MTLRDDSPLLIVEDEPDLRQLYELALVKIGLAVDAVGDVASARQELAQQRYGVVPSSATASSSPTCGCPTRRETQGGLTQALFQRYHVGVDQ